MPYNKPNPTSLITEELCNYNCGQPAKYKFTNGKLCCSKHQNSCPGKRKQFSDRTDHKENAAKSLATRTKLGITKTSQVKGAATRIASGHYTRLAETMKQHWNTNPWQNNTQCPLVSYKDTNINYQGTHEYNFLEKLENINGIQWLINNVKRGPNIWYIDPTDNTKRLYISDFIIDNTIYEVKSAWTWNNNGDNESLENKNKAKLNECINKGYNVIIVLDGVEIKYEK